MSTANGIRFVLPEGKSLFAKVFKPDTRFNTDGVFSIKVVFEPEGIKPVLSQLNKMLDEFIEEKEKEFISAGKPQLAQKVKDSKRPLFDYDYDASGNKTGKVILTATQPAKRKDKNTGSTYDARMTVVDAQLNIISDVNTQIGNGSRVKVSVFAKPYYVASTGCGVKLYLNGVQIIELVKYAPKSNVDISKLGFGVEDGFVSSDKPSADMFESDSFKSDIASNDSESNPFNF